MNELATNMKQGKQTSKTAGTTSPDQSAKSASHLTTTDPRQLAKTIKDIPILTGLDPECTPSTQISWDDCANYEQLIPLFLYCLEHGLELHKLNGHLVALVHRQPAQVQYNVTLRVPPKRSITAFEVLLRAATVPAGQPVKSILIDLAKWLKREYYQPS